MARASRSARSTKASKAAGQYSRNALRGASGAGPDQVLVPTGQNLDRLGGRAVTGDRAVVYDPIEYGGLPVRASRGASTARCLSLAIRAVV